MAGLELRYFILKPKGSSDHAFASRMAMTAYASQIKKANPELTKDLREWVERERQAVVEEQIPKPPESDERCNHTLEGGFGPPSKPWTP